MNIFEMNNLCYGGDYNPEQWIDYDGIWDEDIRLMKKAGINCVTIGVFSWAMLEKEEGKFDFAWLDNIIEMLYKNDIKVILATPSAARPAWLAQKYPEVLRTREDGKKMRFGGRHNHCLTSPLYREKVAIIDSLLAERYGKHPAVIMWHISNEFSGDCHCPRCVEHFREWLKDKYHNSLDELNHAWWSTFWSHRCSDWSQIEPPSSIGEFGTHGLNLDWKRYVTDMTIDFFNHEVSVVRQYSDLPVTTNFMDFEELNYHKFAKHVDIVSWDSYPSWHNDSESLIETAMETSFHHDMFRCMKQKPFIMLESTPSLVNWKPVNKLKEPGMNALAMLQAVAHGSEGAMYFQIRKSRGSCEKFHGAVIDHEGSENTRVYKEAAEIGSRLAELSDIKGSHTKSDIALIYDYENSWAIGGLCGLKYDKGYKKTCIEHYSALREYGVNVDVIGKDADFSDYKIICAPMLYMMPDNISDKIRDYVKNGGIFAATYLTSYADEKDLCHLNGFPGNLKDVFGIWNEEIDSIHDKNAIIINNEEYDVADFCELIHPDDDTEVLGTYKHCFYAGYPALTRHSYGSGGAYYIAARTGKDFLKMLYGKILAKSGIKPLAEIFDKNIAATQRGENIFLMNFSSTLQTAVCKNRTISLKPYECVIIPR